jgi:hypothetical protein
MMSDDIKDNDIEEELGNEDIKSEIPFDPNDINITIIPRTIGQLVDMLEYDEILMPKFQRLPNLWTLREKSRFIESLMLNLPIPLFYFAEAEDKKWHVIDGLQRISTLEHFILGDTKKTNSISKNKTSFKLENLEFKTEFNGEKWDKLPRDIQRRINTNQVTINLIGKGTPDQVKYNIFSRINQGGVPLKPQEIRTALFQGYKVDFIESLVSEESEQGKAFIKATDGSIPKRRQEDLDFATRFIAFYILGYERYEPDMDSFLTLGTKNIPINKKEQGKIINDFNSAMVLAFEIFVDNAFRKLPENGRRKPINKPLFEVISVHFAKLNNEYKNKLIENKILFLSEHEDLQNDREFKNSISTGTANKDSVKERHEKFKNLLEKYIQ